MKKILVEYPKFSQLRDGSKICLRPMNKKDKPGLIKLFKKLSATDRLYLRDDVSREDVIEKWVKHLDYEKVFPIFVEKDGDIIGDATLHMEQYGWKKHLGEIRIVVSPECRNLGVGTVLAKEIFYVALKMNLRKLIAEVMSEQKDAINVFERLGFIQEAVLRCHVLDSKGREHDLVIMTNDVEELWQSIQNNNELFNFPGNMTEN